jgi:hypothetical protein
MNDNSTYSAITDRISILEGNSEMSGDVNYKGSIYEAFRGDCYICQYT